MPERWQRARSLIFQIYVLAATAGFLLLAVLAAGSDYSALDLAITRAVQSYDAAWFAGLMVVVSWPGFSPQILAIIGLAVLIFYRRGLRREARLTLAGGAGSLLLNLLLKLLIQRPRPAADIVNVLRSLAGYSFPSGHVMFYVVFFGFLGFLAWTHLRPGLWRGLLVGLCAGLVALVGPSRIYLGQHWFSDVLAAYLIASLGLAVLLHVYRKRL